MILSEFQRHPTHDSGARALFDEAFKMPNLRIAAIAPNNAIANYAMECLNDAVIASVRTARLNRAMRSIELGNKTVIYFFTADRTDRMQGQRFHAYWLIAGHMLGEHYDKVLEAMDVCQHPELREDNPSLKSLLIASHG